MVLAGRKLLQNFGFGGGAPASPPASPNPGCGGHGSGTGGNLLQLAGDVANFMGVSNNSPACNTLNQARGTCTATYSHTRAFDGGGHLPLRPGRTAECGSSFQHNHRHQFEFAVQS